MNILLNNYCNLKCEYCFANEVIAEGGRNLPEEDFRWLLNFLDQSHEGKLRLIGGEPTLHPRFSDFLLEAARRSSISHIHLFTNGTYDDRIGYLLYLLSKDKKLSILLNYNHPKILGPEKTGRILHNIGNLSKTGIELSLGINFFRPDQEYDYLIETAVKYGLKGIRWAIVVPNTDEKKVLNVADYFNQFVPLITGFIKECAVNQLEPHVDCNNIPLCILDDDTLRLIALLSEKNLKTSICNPVIDVKPDMTAIRCFGFSKETVNIRDFNNLKELKDYFLEKVDRGFDGVKLFESCSNCASYQIHNKSCACLGFERMKE